MKLNWVLYTFSSLIWQSKKRFEREWREAERAAQYAEKTDQDINATKADVEKVRKGGLIYIKHNICINLFFKCIWLMCLCF